MVLSLTKIGVVFGWLLTVYAALYMREYLVDILGALALAHTGYGYRRYMQYSNSQSPYPNATPAMRPTDPPGTNEEEPNASD